MKTRNNGIKSMIVLVLALMIVVTGCSQPGSNASTSNGGNTNASDQSVSDVVAGLDSSAVGFIFVGTKDDYGYNQAAYLGSVAVEEAYPDLKVIRAENVPESAEAERVMEQMIQEGAKIIFPTSYGHLEPALNVAKRHPDVLFYHQGGLKTAENLGTYFGTIWEPVYLAGVAAGKMSETGKLGFIVSVPIPQVLLNINAFTLGAQSVNPEITTNVVFTGSWCDPGQQANAANSLIDAGADLLTLHQDCMKTVVETAERSGIMTVGYHADANELAPNGWVTGSEWNWGDLFVDMVKVGTEGQFKGSKYDGKYRGTLADEVVKLSTFGANVPEEVQQYVEEQKAGLLDGTLNPFAGPINDQSGSVRIEVDQVLSVEDLESTNYLVEGVIGTIPQ